MAPSEQTLAETNARAGTLSPDELWQALRARLESTRRRINEEIEHYPPPIPRCDAQFNYLLEERAAIARELSRLDAAWRASYTSDDPLGMVNEFIRLSHYLR